MGVPKFFRYISERYPCLSEALKEYQIPEFDNLYLDMNGIIHICSHPNDSDVQFRITEEEIFKNIFHYVEILFRMIQPQKLFFLAVDGVAPRAKINQQRARRFRSAKEAEIQEAKARAAGVEIPNEKRFDSNCITPGTLFMSKLNKHLRFLITYKISTDSLWRKCKIIFSGSEVPGEGEHKIMDYIRYMKAQPDYDYNTRHCLYGLDADLIMLGLCTHELHFSLLREEVKFNKRQKRILIPEETKFCLLHLSLLRDYLFHEFSPIKDKLPFPFDIEHIIDDWVLMGFLVGNDFIPHLPNLDIVNGALPILYHAYMEILPTLEGYINESGTLKLDRFEKFMERLSRLDMEQFEEHYCDLKYFEAKLGKPNNENDELDFKSIDDTCENISTKIENKELDASPKSDVELIELGIEPWLKESCEGLDDESDNEMYNIEFTQHKRDYYMNKLEYENVDENVLRSQAEGYVRAIQWNLNYYYNGCCSWSWYYPHHYAPYISDIKDFKNLKLEFELGEPFLPFEQLLAVLPPYSKELLPEAFQTLLTEEQSPIIEYYPEEFKTDLNGKKQDWEAVVLIPFIDEKNLLNAMEPYYNKLTEEEQERNKHGPMMIYTYTQEDLGLYQGPEYFLSVRSHAKVTLMNREDTYVPPEKLIKGLHPGVKPDLYFPGFPTLKYIPHEAHLEKVGVKVFEQPARGESMILCIPQQEEKCHLKELAVQLLGTTVYVEWPYLREAQVIGISDCKLKVSLINPQLGYSSENVVEETAGTISVTQWNAQKKSIIETYKKRLGIDIGQIDILILARPLVGSKYIFETQGRITVGKQWQESSVFYAHQVIVRDISTYSINVMPYKTVDEIFTPKSICFMLGHPHYGTMGKVADTKFDPRSGRIKVCMKVTPEPDLSAIRQAHAESRTQYIHGSIAAQRLGISSHLLSRITGSIYVIRNTTDNTQEFVKHNVGLNLKFNKKNEEVPGYTKKENSQWLYSIKAIDLIRDYMIKCPVLFERLAQNISNDIFNEDELLDKDSGELDSIVSWLKEQHFRTVESRACGTNVVDVDVVRNIEKELNKFLQTQERTVKPAVIRLQVKPHLLFKPELHSRRIPPDPKSHNRLLDRIICTRGSFTVPIGYKGIIIGIQAAETLADTMYDIVFDKLFLGGLSISGCSHGRGYRLSITDFINISHGERIERGKPGSENVFPGSVRLQNVKNQQHENVSAFASFSKMNNQPKILSRSPQMQLKKNIDEISHNATVQLPDTSRQRRCQQNVSETRKNASSFRSAAPEADQLTKQLPSEFQQLWNELHKTEDPNRFLRTSVPMKHDQNSKVAPQRNERSSQDPSAFLKEVLKISDNNTQTKASTKSKDAPIKNAQSEVSDAPPLVQKLFDYARQRKGEVQEDRGPIWYCSQLLNHYQVLGMGLPRYDYYLNEQTNLIHAQILLPDAKIFVGDPCTTHAHAAESAAKKVCEQLHLDKTQKPGIKLSMKPQYGKTSAINNFQYSRQKKSEIKDDKNPIWYCSQLLNYYQLRGIGLPRYDYFINEQTNLIRAQVLLPDAKIFVGDPCVTHAHAAESAAKKVYEQLHLDKAQKTDMKLLLKPPPQQWFNTRQNNNWSPNVRPPSMMHMNPPPMDSLPRNLKWNMKSRQNTGFAQAPGQSNQIKPPSLPKTAETKPEIKNSTSFVPLQAQKQSRNVNKQTAKTAVQNSTKNIPSIKQQKKEETFPKPPKVQSSNKPVEKEPRVQNNSQSSPKSQKSAKPKRSRVAAKFVSPPTMNGSEPQ